ncbi:hypothetical protein Y1Q_0004065 [Alligator mississippiensis]|uniref:Uncharacterized protein n=1 Tax=Alligator mississippiensis TaxID=8496 RepID=A0A151PHS3_ALLMI|nr:hypothetical protein Y1Q_0004065 [Alligator mississippiensis]
MSDWSKQMQSIDWSVDQLANPNCTHKQQSCFIAYWIKELSGSEQAIQEIIELTKFSKRTELSQLQLQVPSLQQLQEDFPTGYSLQHSNWERNRLGIIFSSYFQEGSPVYFQFIHH